MITHRQQKEYMKLLNDIMTVLNIWEITKNKNNLESKGAAQALVKMGHILEIWKTDNEKNKVEFRQLTYSGLTISYVGYPSIAVITTEIIREIHSNSGIDINPQYYFI